jgi:hypothetical protein
LAHLLNWRLSVVDFVGFILIELLSIQQKMNQLKCHLQGQFRHFIDLHFALELLILLQVVRFFALHLSGDFLSLLLLSFHLISCFFFLNLQQLNFASYELVDPFLIEVFFTQLELLIVIDQGHFKTNLHLQQEFVLPRLRPHYHTLLPHHQLKVSVPTLLLQFLAVELQNWIYFSCLQAR